MGILFDPRSKKNFTLPSRCNVGRSFACMIRVNFPSVSGDHACISYESKRWKIRDLRSRNGTFVNGQKVHEATLERGDKIAFGSTKIVFDFIDASPPVALARNLKTNEVIVARDGLLAVPSAEVPLASVFETPHDGWVLETGGDVKRVSDGDLLDLDQKSYMLHLPTILDVTMDSSGDWISAQDIGLRFRVRRNEEYVDVAVQIRNELHVLAVRAHHYTLLTLARLRLADQANPKLVSHDHGWVTMDDLCRKLATDENKINVEIYRIRQEFLQLPLQNGAAIIERKKGSKMLRIGVHRLRLDYID